MTKSKANKKVGEWSDKVDWSKENVKCPSCDGYLRCTNITTETKLCRCDSIGCSPRCVSIDNTESYRKKRKAYEEAQDWSNTPPPPPLPSYTPPVKVPLLTRLKKFINSLNV